MNPDDKKMIPIPMLGFSSLHQRLKLQEQMSHGHQNRSDLLQKEIRELQVIYFLVAL
jgi:nuclear pore complex protein Nup54